MKTIITLLPLVTVLAISCGDDSSSTPDETTGNGTTGEDPTSSSGSTTAPMTTTMTTNPTTADTTADPPSDCDRTIRYTLYDNQACGRVFVGDIDGDAFTDLVAFGRDPEAVLTPISQTMHTFEGSGIGLQMAEVHCCTDSSTSGYGAIFDINGDLHGDAIWASERTVFSGDVGETELTIHKRIRGPERGWVGDGLVFAHGDDLPAPVFAVGRITPQETGVLAIADGGLHSMRGTGDELGLEIVSTLLLDPMPTIHALATVEFDGMQGVDVVGVGPDGVSLWGGSLEGTFADAVVTKLPGDYRAMQSIDTDLDGARQLVLFGEDEPVALVDSEDGVLTVTTTGTPTLDRPGVVGAVDSGVYPDLVAKDGDNLVYYPGDGKGFGDPVVLAPIGDVAGLAFGDFDANGFEDVVACDEQGLLVVYHGDE
jgi:hypothetical protein